MAKVFLFDYDHCNGCRGCQVACKDEHCDQAWPPYAAAQPMVGQFWMKIDDVERGRQAIAERIDELCCLDAIRGR